MKVITKYILHTEYPGSPKEGTVVEYDEAEDCYKSKDYVLPASQIEPAYWRGYNPFRVGDKVTLDTMVRTVTAARTFEVDIEGIPYRTEEFKHHNIKPATEQVIKSMEALRKYTSEYTHNSWLWIRRNDPKAYWNRILLAIAEDLNKGAKVEEFVYTVVQEKGRCRTLKLESSFSYHFPTFNTQELALKAIEIINGNLSDLW